MDFNIIHLTDIHGAIDNISMIGRELKNADLVILSGDITHFGGWKDIDQIIKTVSHFNKNIYAVPGNCDNPDVNEFLSKENINLNKSQKITDAFIFCGLGGSLPCPGYTPFEFTEDEAGKWLKDLYDKLDRSKPLIFVSHQPPFQTQNDRLLNGDHVGSRSVREFIEIATPFLCLTGHIHEGIGIDNIGKCKIVNPGTFRSGRYASLSISDKSEITIDLKQITVH